MKTKLPSVFAHVALLILPWIECAGCGSDTNTDHHDPAPDASPADASKDAPSSEGGADASPDAVADAPVDATNDASADAPEDASTEAGDDAAPDALTDAPPDALPDGGPPFVPTEMHAGLIHSGPGLVATPATWNAHLPKLVGDGSYWYAVHTHFPQDVATRYAAIMRRPVGSAIDAWVEVARVSYPHQPPGIVMDTSNRLHMVFDCLRPAAQDVTCFQGGAGTAGNTSRFYHLVFSARDATNALRFDSYANHSEWTAESNGYLGIGTTADGTTVWALANSSWGRVVQWWASGSQLGTTTTLTVPNGYLLYPIIAGHPTLGSAELLLYAGEFDPAGGNNASYVASTAYAGSTSSLQQLFRRAPTQLEPGAVNAYPSDLAYDPQGTLFALSYLPNGAGDCTELLRFDGGLAQAPTVLPVGCVSNYAKLKFSSQGVLYVLTPGSGANARVGVSGDRGDSFTWHDIPIVGLPVNGDVRYIGYTPVKPYTSPTVDDPDRWVVFFAGLDGSNQARFSYVGELGLSPS